MSEPKDILTAVATQLDLVTGLRPTTKAGKPQVPAAIVELDGITAPGEFGGSADYQVRVVLLVALGEFRASIDKILELADPDGTTSTSAFAALLGYGPAGPIRFDMGDVEHSGQTYGGGIFTFPVYG
jgi:hypothetical protein